MKRTRGYTAAVLGSVTGALAFAVPEASGAHGPRGVSTHALSSGGFPWDTVLLWVGIGAATVLILGWIVDTGRRHHWHLHRPAPHH